MSDNEAAQAQNWRAIVDEVTRLDRIARPGVGTMSDDDILPLVVRVLQKVARKGRAIDELLSRAEQDVVAEREKQRQKWGDAHDDEHTDFAISAAAAHLACPAHAAVVWGDSEEVYRTPAPDWAADLRDKFSHGRTGQRQRLIIAAALMIAEVERLDRRTDCLEGS